MFQLDPSLPFASAVNPSLADQQRLGLAAQYNQVIQGYPSDLLAGSTVNGVNYNTFTFTQQKILAFYAQEANQQAPNVVVYPPEVFQQIADNPGPSDMWNYSYNQWGVVTGVGAAFATLNTVEVSTARPVTVIVPAST